MTAGLAMHGLGPDMNAQSANHFDDSGQFRVSTAGQRLIQSLTGQSGIPCEIGHSFGSGNVTQGSTYQAPIAGIFIQASVKVCRHFIVGSQVVYHIPLLQRTGFHLLLPFLLSRSQVQGRLDILGLRTFVSAREKNDQLHAALHEIHTISGAVVNTHFGNPLPHSFAVAQIAQFRTPRRAAMRALALLSRNPVNHVSNVWVVKRVRMAQL